MHRSMKKIATSFLAVVAAPMVANANFATDGIYVSGLGGIAFTQNMSPVTYKTGFDLGAAIGMKQSNIRYEGEFSWQRTNGTFLGFSGRTNVYALMANLHYDFDDLDMHPQIVPSIGGGIGWGHVRSNTNVGNGNDNTFAYQAMVNVHYHVTTDWSASVGYKFFGTTKVKHINNKMWNNHIINLGVTYRFG